MIEEIIKKLLGDLNLSPAASGALTGVIGVWALGVITYICRGVPDWIEGLTLRFFRTQLILTSQHRVYYDIVNWLGEYLKSKKLASWKASNGRWGNNDSSVLSLGYGTHYVWYRKKLLIVYLTTRRDNENGEFETITISKFGKGHGIFIKLLEEAREHGRVPDQSKVYTYDDGWDFLDRQPNRPLSSIILEQGALEQLIARVDRFLDPEYEKWCIEKGIPYRLGILLHGPPGTGKTSVIKALASYAKRELLIVSAKAMDSIGQALCSSDSTPNNSLYAIEDIDAHLFNPRKIGEILSALSDQPENKNDEDKDKGTRGNMSDLLNALDGITATHGRIVIMTTNHLDTLPHSLLRPGRVDLMLEIGYFNLDMFRRYLKLMYEQEVDLSGRQMNPGITGAMLQCDTQMRMSLEELIEKYTTRNE